MLNWPALLLAVCAYGVGWLCIGAYPHSMPDGYRWLMFVFACVFFGALFAFIASLKPTEVTHENQ